MSHVEEGALHAYLDGALDEFPGAEARWIREHLESCAQCADDLAEARQIRDGSGRILEASRPSAPYPTLEELKRLARPSSTLPDRRRPHRAAAWAASIVLALGVGWVMRGQSSIGPGVAAGDPLEPDATGMVAESRRAGAPSSAVRRSGSDEDRVDSNTPLPRAPKPLAEPEVESDVLVAELDVASAEEAARVVGDDLLGPPPEVLPPTLADLPTMAGEDVREVRIGERIPTREGAPTQVTAGLSRDSGTVSEVASREARSVLARRIDGVVAFPEAAGFSGERSNSRPAGAPEAGEAPGSLVVPGLEVLSIVWREEGVAPAGVRVLQRLESGDTLEVIHLPEGFDPDALAPAPDSWAELDARRPGQGWVVLRAPLGHLALQELLDRLEPPSP